ncbi:MULTISPECIES: Mut7-C RNAse domain-containing protein [Methylomonas]|uniref:Mut7-C RNAse domain-containing protein n=1 Tax=Methylomonas TaxID=416 RepID=UPI0012322243|nr:Mut7-C RNAse domain-containing protein [Methylomonas rhizoryzae]
MSTEHTAQFRFYAQLNDFLPLAKRQRSLDYRFNGFPGVKDPIEVLGVPHTEVGLLVVNGRIAGFDYRLQPGDRVAVYPAFSRFAQDLPSVLRRPLPGRPAFVVDVNLGKLPKRLRLLGFDCLYRNDYSDSEIAAIAASQQRIVLTRDRRLLFAKIIEYGYWVRAVEPERQLHEVLSRFDLYAGIDAFSRCLACNGLMEPVEKAEVLHDLQAKTQRYYQVFYRCSACRRIYWEGSHVAKMKQRLRNLIK